jgi:hypothetical protein
MPQRQFGSSRGVSFQCKDSLRSEVALGVRLGWGIKFERILWLMAQAFVTGKEKLQVPPLRFAPVGMTKEGVVGQ